MVKKTTKRTILERQIRLQDEIDHNADIGYLPPEDKVRKLREYERETGIIIKNPDRNGTIRADCPPGFIFVNSFRKSDGTMVRSFCRKRDTDLEIPERYAYRRR